MTKRNATPVANQTYAVGICISWYARNFGKRERDSERRGRVHMWIVDMCIEINKGLISAAFLPVL
jgi:hypothetical protein